MTLASAQTRFAVRVHTLTACPTSRDPKLEHLVALACRAIIPFISVRQINGLPGLAGNAVLQSLSFRGDGSHFHTQIAGAAYWRLRLVRYPLRDIGRNRPRLGDTQPLSPTIVLGVTKGHNGYLPTPEQHELRGYETWPGTSQDVLRNDESRPANDVAI